MRLLSKRTFFYEHRRSLLLALFAAFSLLQSENQCAVCLAQTTGPGGLVPNQLSPLNNTGVQVYGTYDGVRETVGLTNGNVNHYIPLLKLPQRAGRMFELGAIHDSANFGLHITYEGLQGCTGSGDSGYCTTGVIHDLFSGAGFSDNIYLSPAVTLPGGWQLSLYSLQSQRTIQSSVVAYQPTLDDYQPVNATAVRDWILTSPDGSKHAFANVKDCTQANSSQTSTAPCVTINVSDATDGTYARLDTTNASDIVVYLKDGTELHFYGYDQGAGVNGVFDKMMDPNGNIITTQKNGLTVTSITDSVGRIINIGSATTDSNGNTSQAISYKDTNGNPESIEFTSSPGPSASVPFTAQLSGCLVQPGGYNPINISPGNTTPLNLSISDSSTTNGNISIPDPTTGVPIQYSWTEDAADEITKITYPSGGYTRYAFTPLTVPYKSGDMLCTDITASVLNTKYECPNSSGCSGGGENPTSYQYLWGLPEYPGDYTSSGSIVTYPDSTSITHYFSWNNSANYPGVGGISGAQYTSSETSTIYKDSSGSKVKEVDRDYTVYQTGSTGPQIGSTPTCPAAGSGVTGLFIGSLPCRETITTYTGTTVSYKTETDYQPITYTNPGEFSYQVGESLPVSMAGLIDNPTQIREYDYDGSLKRITTNAWSTSYGNNSHIMSLKASDLVTDGSSAFASQTTYTYDSYPNGSLQPSGAANHSTSIGMSRGNLTSITKYVSSGNAIPNTVLTYDDAGNVLSVTDPLSNTTSYAYNDNFTDSVCLPSGGAAAAYVYKITNALGQKTTFSYYSCSGKLASSTDPNLHTTSYSYDDLGRSTSISYPDTGSRTTIYNDTPPVSQTVSISNGATTETISDGLNRPLRSILQDTLYGNIYSDTQYDSMERVASISNPYRNASDSTYGLVQYTYDALGRKIGQLDSDGIGSRLWAYSGNVVTFTDENGNKWQRTYDAMNRLTSVLEPSGSSKSPAMETDYFYNPLNDLLAVTQWGGVNGTSGALGRNFAYDGLSRLMLATNPESGQVIYTYDFDSNLITKTDARGITVGYCYDVLNRVTAKLSVAPGHSVCSSPQAGQVLAIYSYDASSISGAQNTIGRLTDEKSYAGNTLVSERQPYSYDTMGRLLNENQITFVPSTKTYSAAYGYDLAGNMIASTDGAMPIQSVNTQVPCTLPSAVQSAVASWPTLAFVNCYDTTERIANVTSNWSVLPTNIFTAGSTNGYTPAGQPQNWTQGPVLSVTRSYNNRLWLTSISATGQVP
jgi:YD repeat-containing protein